MKKSAIPLLSIFIAVLGSFVFVSILPAKVRAVSFTCPDNSVVNVPSAADGPATCAIPDGPDAPGSSNTSTVTPDPPVTDTARPGSASAGPTNSTRVAAATRTPSAQPSSPSIPVATPFPVCSSKGTTSSCDVLGGVCSQATAAVACQERDQSPGANKIYGPNGIITKATRLVSIVLGVASVVMIMVGGFKYVIASGDPANIKSAKNTILYALIGLGASLIAQAIVIFVVRSL